MPKTIEDVSLCPILKNPGNFRSETMGYSGWSPAERELSKPKEGYNKVNCKYYLQEEGKCELLYFFPTHHIVEHNPCRFAEV